MPERIHIVHAHPEPRSFCTAMAHEACSVLGQRGHVSFSDLYALGFDPVARAEEFSERADPNYLVYAKEQRHAHDHDSLHPDVQREVKALMESDILVLVFPLYWFSVPAMMKGWIDRCFLSGALYGGRRIYGRAPLAGRKAVVGVSLGGREHMFGPQALHGPLAGPGGMLRHLLQGTLGYVGYEVLAPFFAWHVPYSSAAQREQTLHQWRSYLVTLDTQPRLALPDLGAYDEVFRPLATHASPQQA